MGVRGLTTFVKVEAKALHETFYLRDCKVVIDGNSLMFWLANHTVKPRIRIDQEYAAFARTVRGFVEGLKQCGVEPFVIFDGPATTEKLDHVRRTLEGNILALDGMFHSDDEEMKRKLLLPPFSHDAITQLFVELEVPFVFSLADADRELVALANMLDCPLVGADSDFYIFDLTNGYLPLKGMPVCAKKGDAEMRCIRYRASTFCDKYGISQNKLPFLAILLGNDWAPTEIFEKKVFSLAGKFGIQRGTMTYRVEAGLTWLSTRNNRSDEEILEELYASLPAIDKEENKAKVDTCVSLYRDMPDISNISAIFDRISEGKVLKECSYKPDNVEDAIRNGFVHFSAYHLVEKNFVGLPTAIVCDTRKHSPHLCAVDIRNFVYSLLLRRFCLASEGPQFFEIEEYDFEKVSYRRTRGVNIFTSDCPFCEQKHSFRDLCKDENGDTQKLMKTESVISRFLDINFEHSFTTFCRQKEEILPDKMTLNYRKRLDVVLLSTFYWFKKTTPKPSFAAALVLTLSRYVRSYIKRQKKTLASPPSPPQASPPPPGNLPEPGSSQAAGGIEAAKKETSEADDDESASASEKENQQAFEKVCLKPKWLQRKQAVQKREEARVEAAKRKEERSKPTFETEGTSAVARFFNILGPPAPGSADLMWVLMEDFEFDMELLHSIAEWQCALWAVFELHQAIEYDRLHLGLYNIFGSNIRLHEIHTRLVKSDEISKADLTDIRAYSSAVAGLLDVTPKLKAMFQAMVDFLLQ